MTPILPLPSSGPRDSTRQNRRYLKTSKSRATNAKNPTKTRLILLITSQSRGCIACYIRATAFCNPNYLHRYLPSSTDTVDPLYSLRFCFQLAAFLVLTLPATLSEADEQQSNLTTAPVSPPNVLFIAIDDLNDWIGCLKGHPQTLTPNIDRLAATGTLFTNAHCPAPACNPSRSAIMTGIAPNKSGLYDNRQKMREILPTAHLLP